jgi:tetratricopeptide (TPR) repeat protein
VRAIADFSQAIGLDAKNATAFYYRGAIYGRQGLYASAIADLDEALRLVPRNKRVLAARQLAEKKLSAALNRALLPR